MDYAEVKDKFGTWADKLKPFIESEKFDKIFDKLQTDSLRGKVICPRSSDTFRAFKECPYENLKCVLIGMSPYHQVHDTKDGRMYVADGIMMSCGNTGKLQPSLDLFYDAVEDDVYDGLNLKMIKEPDLTFLANQGVLLINSSLTAERGKPESHKDLWTEFLTYLIEDVLNVYDRGIPFVFLGQQAQRLSKLPIPFLHYVFEISHPASAAYKQTNWNSEGVFTKINEILESNKGPEFKIKWMKEHE